MENKYQWSCSQGRNSREKGGALSWTNLMWLHQSQSHTGQILPRLGRENFSRKPRGISRYRGEGESGDKASAATANHLFKALKSQKATGQNLSCPPNSISSCCPWRKLLAVCCPWSDMAHNPWTPGKETNIPLHSHVMPCLGNPCLWFFFFLYKPPSPRAGVTLLLIPPGRFVAQARA